MTAPEVADRLQARQAGDGFMARCPAHDDTRASLSIGAGDDGRVLLKCHAGCETPAVVEAMHLTMADLMAPKTVTHKASRVVERYDYNAADGTLVYQVERRDPKDFIHRRPDGKSGWLYKLDKDTPRVPYRLAQLDKARPSSLFVVEGEKDVHALEALGLTATTNSGGAGQWKGSHTQALIDCGVLDVVVVPDNDAPGRKHAEHVAATCTAAGLTVRGVNLPDLPDKADVSDWLRSGGTRDQLLALAAAAPVWAAATVPPVSPPTRWYDEAQREAPSATAGRPIMTCLAEVAPVAVDWLWTGRLARGKYTLIAGDPGGGKTSIALDCASRLSRGLPWPDGTPAPQGKTLLLTAEDGLADTIRPRVDRYGGDPSQIIVLQAVTDPAGPRPLDLARDLAALTEAITMIRPALVIIDPISAYLGRTDAHRDGEVRGLLAPLVAALEQHQAALLAVAHLNKDATRAALHRPGGSIAFVAAARLAFAVASDPNDDLRRILTPLKANICKAADSLAFRIIDGGIVWELGPVTDLDAETLLRPSPAGGREDNSDAELVIRDLLADVDAWPMQAKDATAAAVAHGIHERTFRRAAARIGIQIKRVGFGQSGRWVWHRPAIADTVLYDSDVSPMSSMEVGKPQQIPIGAIEDIKSAFTRARGPRGDDPVEANAPSHPPAPTQPTTPTAPTTPTPPTSGFVFNPKKGFL